MPTITSNKKLLIPVVAAAALAAPALAGCGAQTAATPVTAANQTVAAASTSAGQTYTDGTYQGSSVAIQWGDVQVQAVIEGGKITDVEFLTYPSDNRSQQINNQAAPKLAQEAIQAQSASVQVVSGATYTSKAFMESLSAALEQAA